MTEDLEWHREENPKRGIDKERGKGRHPWMRYLDTRVEQVWIGEGGSVA